MKRPIITFGCPVYEDFDGLWATIQSFCLHHPEIAKQSEIIVVDDHPNSANGAAVRGLIEKSSPESKVAGFKYLSHAQSLGPALSKNDVFLHASADTVVCCDAHVLFPLGVFEDIVKYFKDNPKDMNLHCGPNPLDDLATIQTEFREMMRGEMWGIWHSNEQGNNPDNPPYEVWGNGCGFLVCRKTAWLGFNHHFRGFGGEEGYLHEKYRQVGRKVINHPKWRWLHRYESPNRKGSLIREVKLRNMVLGFKELGRPLDMLYDHFVSLAHPVPEDVLEKNPHLKMPIEALKWHLETEHSVSTVSFKDPDGTPVDYDRLQELHKRFKIPEINWRFLLADPINNYTPESLQKQDLGMQAPDENMEQLLHRVMITEKDLNHHLPKLIEFAKKCEVIEDITRRPESSVAFLSTRPKKLTVSLFGFDANAKSVEPLTKVVTSETELKLQLSPEFKLEEHDIEDCEMLFFKSPHNFSGEMTAEALNKWAPKVRRFIAIHDTVRPVWEETNKQGPIAGIKAFVEAHPEWFICHHTADQYGLTVLGILEEDKPPYKYHAWPPGFGPGTEMKKILDAAGVEEKADCSCNRIRLEMDFMGPEECKKKRDYFVGQIMSNAENWNWSEKLKIAASLAMSGGLTLADKFQVMLNPTDVYGSLFDIAVQRAEATNG